MCTQSKDRVVSRAFTLITKLQKKYGFKTGAHWAIQEERPKGNEKQDPAPVASDDWCLVGRDGHRYKLPKTMLFMGREECDIVVKSQTVDKRHAVITFDHYLDKFKIKDLSTVNGTFVNDARIHDQEYVPLEHMDSLRLGYDSMAYRMERVKSMDSPTRPDMEPSTVGPPVPAWVTKELPHMAECEGCIAEQRIEHTCGNHDSDSVLSRRESMEGAPHTADPPSSVAEPGEESEADPKSKLHGSALGSNTWPRKRIRNVPNITTFFTEDVNGSRLSIDDTDYSYACNRVLRGEGGMHPENLPPELETVKKGTPLYGQPDWWGDEETVTNGDVKVPETIAEQSESSSASQDQKSEDQKSTSSKDLNSMSTSVSKDSLLSQQTQSVATPESPGQKELEGKGQENGPGPAKPVSKLPEGSTSMAFTVDFGDDSPRRKMPGKKLSEFVPSKMRKSIDERQKEKCSSKSSVTSSSQKDSLSEKEKESSAVSPGRQKKLDELWGSDGTPVKTKVTTEQVKRSSSKTPSKEEKPEASVKTTISSTAKMHRRTGSGGGPVKAKLSLQKDKGQVDTASNVTDSASYLIDKMFESNSKGTPSKGRRTPKSAVADRFTEHAMYREAKQFENRKTNTTPSGRDSSAKDATKTKRPLSGILKREASATKTQPTTQPVEKKEASTKVQDKAKDEDETSETGTYTIDGDQDSKEEEQAREKIEQVFGVNSSAEKSLTNRTETSQSQARDAGTVPNKGEITLEDIEDQIEDLEKKRKMAPEIDSMEVDVGSAAMEELKIVEEENPEKTLPANAPTWVTQWAALTSQQKNKKMEAPSPDSQRSSLSSDKDVTPEGKKPPRGITRKRPGTGRRLPSLPPDKSPSGSQCSSRLSQSTDSQSPRCPSTPRYGENNNLDSAKSKVVTISNQVVSRFDDTDTETVSKTKFESDTESIAKSLASGEQSPKSSASTRSIASVDTELLLKDTETVMAAMEKRMGSKHDDRNGVMENGDDDKVNRRFSDSESMIAMVNGDDDYERPNQYESPRQNLARSKGLKQHKPLSRVSSASARLQAFREKNYKRNSWTEASVVSDVLSDATSNNLDLETSTERSDYTAEEQESGASFSRSGSKGKGQITMTRPNRAFQLRRLKADGGEPPESPNTGISTALSLTNVSDSGKSQSTVGSSTPTRLNKSVNRLSYPTSKQDSARSGNSLGATIVARCRPQQSDRTDTNRSEASLGDQIANKAKRNSGSFVRSDGGRYSLKLSRSNSTQDSINSTGDTSSYTSSPTRKPDFKAIKSRLKTTPSYGLSVQGMSNRSSSSSQPPSRSNSPKSAEKAAWKRRKEYDPRKAVAEAKAKAREVKVKADATGRVQGRMIRSASFTNTKELHRFRKDASAKSDSVSSVDDTSFASEVNDTYDDSILQRGFVPYSGRSQSSRLFSGSEDDEVGLMVKSTHDLSHSVVGTLRYKSAFTPPPPKSNPSPRSSPPPLPLSVFKKRYSYDSNKTPPTSSSQSQTPKALSSPNSQVQSYDSILVSSIYQLSLKMKSNTDKTLQKLRDGHMVENGLSSPSPIDDILDHSSNSDMPGWKQANRELAGILKNLRKLDHHIQVMHRALFPDDDSCSDSPGLSGREKQEYLQEIERIRGELAGFQPIMTPDDPWKQAQDQESIESDCEELGAGEEFF